MMQSPLCGEASAISFFNANWWNCLLYSRSVYASHVHLELCDIAGHLTSLEGTIRIQQSVHWLGYEVRYEQMGLGKGQHLPA